MNDEIDYRNNPLHGVGLKKLLVKIVDHYGFDILSAYLNINCFKNNPSIDSSIRFLKKTDWAREKVESFYLYQFKNLPRASAEQFELSPRDRVIPQDQTPGEPAKLSLEDAEQLHEKRTKKAATRKPHTEHRSGSGKDYGAKRDVWNSKNRDNKSQKSDYASENSSSLSVKRGSDPWAKWKK